MSVPYCTERLQPGQVSHKSQFHISKPIFRLTLNIKLEMCFSEEEKKWGLRLNKKHVYECNAATHLKITNVSGKKGEFSYKILTMPSNESQDLNTK